MKWKFCWSWVLLEDFGELIGLRLSTKEWPTPEEFGENASARPHVDWRGVAGRQQHFRRPVPQRHHLEISIKPFFKKIRRFKLNG